MMVSSTLWSARKAVGFLAFIRVAASTTFCGQEPYRLGFPNRPVPGAPRVVTDGAHPAFAALEPVTKARFRIDRKHHVSEAKRGGRRPRSDAWHRTKPTGERL